MSENDHDIILTKLRDMGEDARSVLNLVEELRSEIISQRELLKEARKQANEARSAEELAKTQYREALDLKEGKYSELISDLFEKPKMELVRKLKIWSTVGTTVAVIGICLTTGISIESAFRNMRVYEATKDDLKEITLRVRESMEMTENQLKIYALENSNVVQIRDSLMESHERFRRYSTINDIIRAFKIDIVHKVGPQHYGHYLAAFRLFGLKGSMPSDEDLRIWDEKMITLYGKWVKEIDKKKGSVKQDSPHRHFATFAAGGERRILGNWKFDGENLKYKELRKIVEERMMVHIQQKALNVQVGN